MSLPHRSVSTIDNVEFVNLTPNDINPMMSQCEIKVFYVGQNRNQSYISKEVATEIAKTLRGAPIVGAYRSEKEDFTDHGQRVTIDDEGVHFSCATRPYGFVAPDAQVWFKKFSEQDDFGNPVEREYLMTTGYLWTGQYEEAKQVVDKSKPQSMELDNDSLQGHWAEDNKNGMEFFIINDAIISKLCILGDDVQPCFEGAAITKPEISASFALDNKFKTTLFDMMKQLEFVLKGDKTVEDDKNLNSAIDNNEQKPAEQFSAENTADEQKNTSTESEFAKNQDKKDDPKQGDSTDSEDNKEQDAPEENPKKEDDGSAQDAEDDEEKKKPAVKNSLHTDEEYAALEQKFNELQTEFNDMKTENEKLIAFKNDVEDKQKDELIAKFYMLDDADKKDVIENKRNYSLDDIESKLAVICYRKKVDFSNTSEKEEEKKKPAITFDVDGAGAQTEDWVEAVLANQNKI